MNFGKMIKKVVIGSTITTIVFCLLLFFPIIAVVGVVVGNSDSSPTIVYSDDLSNSGNVRNNLVYSKQYRKVMNKYLKDKGYVSLERLVFYLQHTNNIIDVSVLSMDKWYDAYLKNIDSEQKQMIPIAEICKQVPNRLSNLHDTKLDAIELCNKTILESTYKQLPYSFPLKANFTVTSFTYEQRKLYGSIDIHNGWDFAVPIGTKFYSICDGKVSSVVNTQPNDLKYSLSGNDIGNYVIVTCENNYKAIYYHIKYKSSPFHKNDSVSRGDFLGLTSTTGNSTGPHLHLGLKDSKGNIVDPMDYIDMKG